MLRLYTDESPGLKVDPMVILFLSLGFIFSVVALHRHKEILLGFLGENAGGLLRGKTKAWSQAYLV
ncbi:Arf guanine nucleotide exchange factor sbh1 [Exophiala xenobiotica]|nr:Arf guanine nucleotide exchange factor sbh1 [Exophiala xenobiotica]KAK5392666.1 Arf guanine nucleotide exchange factor sbh1 [Exophiala xenobiotica]KAK5457567.1 Arf guanine nucleotide exchange factor sbh1 [Exophiala xenobiotica]KAK5511510.1 Arf guanine nucleotide exchange factor sbh1 [Exophiala xenobiotica]